MADRSLRRLCQACSHRLHRRLLRCGSGNRGLFAHLYHYEPRSGGGFGSSTDFRMQVIDARIVSGPCGTRDTVTWSSAAKASGTSTPKRRCASRPRRVMACICTRGGVLPFAEIRVRPAPDLSPQVDSRRRPSVHVFKLFSDTDYNLPNLETHNQFDGTPVRGGGKDELSEILPAWYRFSPGFAGNILLT